MNPEKEVTPLDKEALVLLPGLRYARSLIDLAMQVSRHSALRKNVSPRPAEPSPPKEN